MDALTWHGEGDVRLEDVPKPEIEEPTDVIVEVTVTAICGSDLHLYNDFMPGMQEGDVLGHEPVGEVVEVGDEVENLREDDRVVVPFTISCDDCWFCENDLYSFCDETNPNAEQAREAMGHSPAGLFGFSHTLGGYDGGQAEYLRVPHADVGPIKVENDSLTDQEVLFLSDIFPTGYMATENAEIDEGDTVAVWGCGSVGQFAIQSAWMLGADRVLAVDPIDERLKMAKGHADTESHRLQRGGRLRPADGRDLRPGPRPAVSTPSARRSTTPASITSPTNLTVPTSSSRRSGPAGRAAPSRSLGSTSTGWTTPRWDR